MRSCAEGLHPIGRIHSAHDPLFSSSYCAGAAGACFLRMGATISYQTEHIQCSLSHQSSTLSVSQSIQLSDRSPIDQRSSSGKSGRRICRQGTVVGERRYWQVREGCWAVQHRRVLVHGRVPRLPLESDPPGVTTAGLSIT